ncbi:MAG: lysylphosphatidylglycerol synthase transmembrane domain-containing protein [Beijerinckiaceae bacterium]
MKRIRDFFWPAIGLVAVVWSVRLLYVKMQAEVSADPAVKARLDALGLWGDVQVISSVIAEKLTGIPPTAYLLAFASTLLAYAALAWYDRIALIHLNRQRGISFIYVAVCSFVTYALSHNIGASVFSGGMVRFRAYTAKGLSAAEVAVLVGLCSYTFAFGVIILLGLVLVWEPGILAPLSELSASFGLSEMAARGFGVALLAFCALYTIGSWRHFPPLKIGGFELVYPRLPIVARQYIAAPLELIGAAGIIYFALPHENTTFMLVLGAFLLSFSAGLLSQVPGGVGVMEAVFLAIMPQVPATSVFAALLVWRLFYLILPLVASIPVVLLFERSQLGKATRNIDPPTALPR